MPERSTLKLTLTEIETPTTQKAHIAEKHFIRSENAKNGNHNMSKTIKTFGVWTESSGRSDGIIITPHVKIILEQWTIVGSEIPAITADLVNEAEIDTWIDLLKADLEAAGTKAKAAIRRARKETAAIAANRKST